MFNQTGASANLEHSFFWNIITAFFNLRMFNPTGASVILSFIFTKRKLGFGPSSL